MARKSKRVVKSKASKRYADRHPKVNYAFWIFINILLVAIFIYGIYRMWKYSWVEGLSIIVFDLLVILILKLYFKLTRK
ncbi:MAG: hypothetical protein WC796_05775 [Candidatus Pacearchaeota archaeon]|jgi:hypothetical protein